MKFNEFKSKIEQAFARKFPKSYCNCRIVKCLGRSISIDCLLAENEKECPWNQAVNDMMKVFLHIELPSEWNDEDDLPENLSMKALRNCITVKPVDPCLFCSYKTVNLRVEEGNSEKMINIFENFVGHLYAMIEREYQKRNLMDRCMDLIKAKGYFND